jgi:hypothetical protein
MAVKLGSPTLWEERRLRAFENKVLRRLFGPKRDEVTGEWRKFITRSLMICTPHHYCAGDKIEKNGRVGCVAPMGEVCTGVGGKTSPKETTGKTQA